MAKPISAQPNGTFMFRNEVRTDKLHNKGEHVMADKFTFGSAGEIQDLEFALARNGWTHALLKKATGGDFFGLVREVAEGRAEICRIERLTAEHKCLMTQAQHIIDCDADPFVPSGLKVESHQKSGQLVFDPARIILHLSKNQQGGKYIEGNKLQKGLASESVLNANVLDYLLKNTHLIPESWKNDDNGNTRYIFFWGTIYRDSFGSLCVRYLCFYDGRWDSFYRWLGRGWGGNGPAALRAS